jgi:hypothetical protein
MHSSLDEHLYEINYKCLGGLALMVMVVTFAHIHCGALKLVPIFGSKMDFLCI